MPENDNDVEASSRPVNHNRKRNWPHLAIVGGMAVGLGAAIITGLKKSTSAHVVCSLCFVGTAMLHLFMNHRKFSSRMKNGFLG